ncbi:MAG: Holliday junction resolvase RuvX [Parachlamydiales bacterium]
MGRTLGVDYGLKRIGLAISDPFGTISLPFAQVETGKSFEATLKMLRERADGYEVHRVVIGLPHKLGGGEGTLSPQITAFADYLREHSGWQVELFDERLSSLQADRALKEANLNRRKRTEKLDMVAATYILQAFLDSRR